MKSQYKQDLNLLSNICSQRARLLTISKWYGPQKIRVDNISNLFAKWFLGVILLSGKLIP